MKPQSKLSINNEIIEKIQKECDVGRLSALLLYQRGIINKEEVKKFFYGAWKDLCRPFVYNNMTEIVNRLRLAVENKQKIVIYGDYDCDGIGATAIYYLAFRDAGLKPEYYIPTRKDEGYGLNIGAIDKIKKDYSPDILLTADCGITSVKEIDHAKELGMEVIVTDHHTPGEVLPDCLYTDPCFTPELTQLCAAGVALYVIRGLFGEEEARKFVDICAISTIADIVPLDKDNRILTKTGLNKIHSGNTREGLKILIQMSKCNLRTLSVTDISFRISPRLNAAGRLSTPIDSLRLLIEDDPTILTLLAENLSLQNSERQQLSANIFNEAMEQLKGYDFGKYRLIMLYGKWNEGVVGIVCSRLTELFHLPTILLCEQENGTLCGSARSIEGINLYELLNANEKYLLTYGGHAMAAGLSLKNNDFIAARDGMNITLEKADQTVFLRKSFYDTELPTKSVSWDILHEIDLFAPFGASNPPPVFYDENPGLNFKKGSDSYPIVKARTQIGEAVSFNGLPLLPLLAESGYSFLYTIDKNTFNGQIRPQFSIKKFFFNNYKFDNEETFWADFLLPLPKQCAKKQNKPVLVVCFLSETVNELLRQCPDNTPVYYGNTDRLERLDSIVLAPGPDFPYFFFGKIVFADLYHPVLADRLHLMGCSTEKLTEKRVKKNISVDYLREIFIYYSKANLHGKKNDTFSAYYEEKNPLIGSKEDFTLASYVLAECGLLKIDAESGDPTVIKKKADPTSTMLYKYIRGDL